MNMTLSGCLQRANTAIGREPRPNRSTGVAAGVAFVVAFAALFCAAQPASAQFMQQGNKLVGSGASSFDTEPAQGHSVALSANGNTAIVGGSGDNGDTGAAWVFTRSAGVWSQQGAKLVGSGAVGSAEEGWSVALSADGNTALVGGPFNNVTTPCCSTPGAVWVFTRSGSVWSPQGAPLVGSGGVGSNINQGTAVALSADGNTALVGGNGDNSSLGAAWVFTRSGNTWSPQGSKLVGAGNTGAAGQGTSVALSADGNTAILGGPNDNGGVGAAWVFTRSGGVWSAQGPRLVGTANTGAAHQGNSVALSADGNTAIIGGPGDNSNVGAAWIFTRSGGTWSQQGARLVGASAGASKQGTSVGLSATGNIAILGVPGDTANAGAGWVFSRSSGGAWSQQGAKLAGNGASGAAGQGSSIALSADGNTAILGGPGDSSGFGAAWTFVKVVPTNTHDFSDDGVSDILWRQSSSGELAMWLISKGLQSSGANISQVPSAWSVVGTRDFNGDGDADILWLDSSGDLGIWLMNGTTLGSGIALGNVGTQWQVVGTGDFNGDGVGDILWRDSSTGEVATWLMNNGQFSSGFNLGAVPSVWQVVGTGDFDGDGITDILWRNTQSGDLTIWFMKFGQFWSGADLGAVPLVWTVVGTGDFNGDGTSDILWRDTSGNLAIWQMSGGQMSSGSTLAQVATSWSVAKTGDFDGDGKSDILWIDTSGDLGVWLMNGLSVSQYVSPGNVGTSWQVQGRSAD